MVKPRENRVPIMMSDEELQAIDDWRYANRVATRSDAVRRLAQIGIRMERRVPDLMRAPVEAMKVASAEAHKINDLLFNPEISGADTLRGMAHVPEAMIKIIDMEMRISDLITEIAGEIAPFVRGDHAKTFEQASAMADEIRSRIDAKQFDARKVFLEVAKAKAESLAAARERDQ